MFLTFLILMFLFASYSANIVALLGAPSSKIKTLEDFLNSRLKMGADDTVFNRFYFPVSCTLFFLSNIMTNAHFSDKQK